MVKRAARAAALVALVMGAGGARANDFEAAVLREVNFARMHPQQYVEKLRAYRDSFDGDVAHDSDEPAEGRMTREGVAAVNEAIAFMQRQQPLPPLADGRMLARAATILTTEQGPSGMIGHYTPAGASDKDRMVRVGGQRFIGEMVAYGTAGPAGVVRQLIVDDGEPRRGHRSLMFQANFRYAGVSCGNHARYGGMCAIDLAEQADGSPAAPGATRLAATPVMAAQAVPPASGMVYARHRRPVRNEAAETDEGDDR